MPQATLTIVTEVTRDDALRAHLKTFQEGVRRTGAPFSLVKGLHFARLAVVGGYPARGLAPQLVFAMVFDGDPRDCVKQLVDEARPEIDAIYAYCVGYNAADDAQKVTQYLLERDCKASLFYQGTEDIDVETLRTMPDVRDALRKRLDETMEQGGMAETTFSLAADAHGKYLAMPDVVGRIKLPPRVRKSKRALARRKWLWVAILVLAALAVSAVPVLVGRALGLGWWCLALGVVPLGLPALELLRRERAEKTRQGGRTVTLQDDHLHSVVEEEDIAVQNALTHCAIVDGPFRLVILRIVFWAIGLRVRLVDSLAGSLGGITSIHFGRWVLIDRGKRARRLVFMSDYDGSWESYLGEFVDRAATGLSAVWSNTENFPPTRLLVFDGATDEQKFKAWTRANQVNTPVWYSAYPQLTLRNTESNLRIVRGASKEPDPPREPAWLASL